MNKLVKASIVGAAGFALLLGGAGTLATWNTSTTIYAGNITAGSLSISQPTVTSDGWYSGSGALSKKIDIDNFHAIPGDTLTYKKTLAVQAVGDNLKARLAIDTSAIPVQGSSAADQAFAALVGAAILTNPVQVFTVKSDPAFAYDALSKTFTLKGDSGTSHTISLSATFTIPDNGLGADNAAMGGRVNLNGLKVTLTQI